MILKRVFEAAPHAEVEAFVRAGRFCPVIRRTQTLTDFLAQDLVAKARETVDHTGTHLAARAASFLLLADGRASFETATSRF